jgi:peptide/nickel transport system ATP-binding protein
MKTILSIEALTVWFNTPKGKVSAVEDVSFALKAGEIFALLGETGCGKSVIGRTILGLPGENAKVSGTIRYKDKQLLILSESEFSQIRGNTITIILQNPDLALNPVLRIGRQLMDPLKHHWKIDTLKAKIRVKKSLEEIGFDDSEEIFIKYPFQLSGGMNQRILIAAAMLTEPELLIADEPTAAMDSHLKEVIKNRLAACRDKYGTTLLLITHDLELAKALAKRVGIMYAGEFVEVNRMSSFLKEPHHPYSKSLIDSYSGRSLYQAPEISQLLTLPSNGCRYAPRCPFKKPQCLKVKPEMISLEKGEVRCLLYSAGL